MGQSETGTNVNEEVLYTLQLSRTGALPSDAVSYTLSINCLVYLRFMAYQLLWVI